MKRHNLWKLALLSLGACIVLFLAVRPGRLPYYTSVRVVRSFPHDSGAFTQGLLFDGSTLFECTGLYGESTVRRVDLETGQVLQLRELEPRYFGEGCTIWNDTLVQLTWKSGVGIVYDKETLDIERQFEYTGEGWGLTHNGDRLIMSDGTSYLRFLDPQTLEELDRVQVRDRGDKPVESLNELEWIRGQVWANVWQTSRIVRIDPDTGQVLGWIDLSELVEGQSAGVLNGIARRGRRVFVTGKRWDAIYDVKVEPAVNPP
jgi:glutaminyl-peptide cyclotransferase